MSNFDWKVEKMEEARMERQNEQWNAMLWESLQTRTEKEVVREMIEMLVIPVGSANVLAVAREKSVAMA